MFTTQSKSQLAKLLAVENITVEHRKMQTAKFDVKNRVLYCPIWKEMSSSMYDLLMGHEVGHALFTPADGWHDAICEKGANYKSFLNVIEDARIEKKVKRKYPGIKRPFVEAYTKLIEDDFFGIKGRNVNNLSFIDRVNLFTKLEGSIAIKFTDYEQTLVDRVLSVESWSDVIAVANEIYDYSKDEQQSMAQEQEKSYEMNDDDEEDSQEMESSEPDSDDSEESGNSDDEESDEDTDEEDYNEFNDDLEPSCGTDDAFRRNEIKLLDDKSKEYIYLELPKFNISDVLTPSKIVHQRMSEFFQLRDHEDYFGVANKALSEFKNKNSRYISLLAKEFEMKKSAKSFAKNKISETGDIDLNKIYKYQVEDNLFRKLITKSKGKSHGLVLVLDKSGSMRNNMGASIEQILVLTMFCRKVSIPFVVYGFGNSEAARKSDFPDKETHTVFEKKENVFVFQDVYLREYLSSTMKANEFNESVKNLLLLKNCFDNGLRYPRSENLTSTPLIESMVVLQPIVKSFKKSNNLDIVNMVLVNDGDADEIDGWMTKSEDREGVVRNHMNLSYRNFFLVDKENRYQSKIESHEHFHWNYDDGVRIAVFEWFRKTTGSKIFGFFLSESSPIKMRNTIIFKYKDEKGKDIAKMLGVNVKVSYRSLDTRIIVADLFKKLKENKFLISYSEGYNTFFILPGGNNLSIEDEELEISGNITVNKLKTAFSKLGKLKSNNRVLVSKFIKGIS
jgi:hypothetical protein